MSQIIKKLISVSLALATAFLSLMVSAAEIDENKNIDADFTPPMYEEPELPNKVEVYRSDFKAQKDLIYSSSTVDFEITELDGETVIKAKKDDGAPWWDAVKIDITEFMEPGYDYHFSAEMMHCGETNEENTLRFAVYDEEWDKTVYQYGTVADEWITLTGTVDLADKEFERTRISFLSWDSGDTFYIKNIVIFKFITDSSAASNYEISMKEEAEKNGGFFFGTLISSSKMNDPNYASYFERHYNIMSCGNWIMLDHSGSKENAKENPEDPMPAIYYDECDSFYEYCRENGMRVRGHALVNGYEYARWFFTDDYTEDGELVSKETALRRVEHYVKSIVTHYESKYPGVTYDWDVINEGRIKRTHSDGEENIWYTYFGDDYVKILYSFARKYSTCKLFYNDWAMWGSGAREDIIEMANWLNDGVPVLDCDGNPIVPAGTKLIDGIGVEFYVKYGDDPSVLNPEKTDYIGNIIRDFSEAGLEVHITEATVSVYEDSENMRKKQAKYLYTLIRLLMEENDKIRADGLPGLSVLTFWNPVDCPYLLPDDYGYGLTGLYSGFLNDMLAPKPAFYAVTAALAKNRFPFD